jgi:hypothetical protein
VGVARRDLLTRVIVRLLAPRLLAPRLLSPRLLAPRLLAPRLLSPGAGPLSDEAVHIASDLVEAADLPPGGQDRRELEELIWARLGDGESSPALRGLALKLGFSAAALAAATENS